MAVARGAAAGTAAAIGGASLEPPTGGGEERRTLGWKALPPWVVTILKSEMEKKGVGGCVCVWGGGGGLQKPEWPLVPIKWLEQKDREINGGHMKRRVFSRRKARGEEQWACERLRKFLTLPTTTPAKQKTKNYDETNL